MHALRDVCLEVDAGELVAVMGPSGSGKSTLLTIAGSLEQPTSGEVLVAGQDLVGDVAQRPGPAAAPVDRVRVPGLQPAAGLTAAENVSLPLELDGISARKGSAKPGCRRWRTSVWPSVRRAIPDELSGGERQRVAIARAAVGDRRLLLADEPSGALDSVNGEAVMRLIRAACQRGVAGVVVTHDAQLASWADRVVFMRDGRVVDQTAPRLARNPCSGQQPMTTAADPPARRRQVTAAPPPGARWSAGRGGCSAASGASSCSCSACSPWRSRRRSGAPAWSRTCSSATPTGQRTAPLPRRPRCPAATRAWPPTSPPSGAAGARPMLSRIRESLPAPLSLWTSAPSTRTGTSTLRCSAWSAAHTRPGPVRSR